MTPQPTAMQGMLTQPSGQTPPAAPQPQLGSPNANPTHEPKSFQDLMSMASSFLGAGVLDQLGIPTMNLLPWLLWHHHHTSSQAAAQPATSSSSQGTA